jgi:hypothetical protein
MARKYKLLSVDAWVDSTCGECDACLSEEDMSEECVSPTWSWNDWHQVDTVDTVPETVAEFASMVFIGKQTTESLAKLEIDDDCYNIVLSDKRTGEPLYAVEYGNFEGDET